MAKQCYSNILHLFLVVIANFAQSQSHDYEFKHYSRRDGLLSSSIDEITQDRDGFLWVSQKNGISRFNGYEFDDFTYVLENDSISYNTIASDNGKILIGTVSHGLFLFDPVKDSVQNFVHDANDPTSIISSSITKIYIDPKGRRWIGTWFGLSKMNDDNSFTSYPFNTDASRQVYNYNSVNDIIEGPHGKIWIGTWGGGLHVFDPETETFQHFEKIPYSQGSENLWVESIEIENGHLYLGTIGDGVQKFNPNTYEFTAVPYLYPTEIVGYSRVLDIAFNNGEELWIGTEEGIVVKNLIDGSQIIINDEGPTEVSIQHRNVTHFFRDNHGGFWIGAGGLSYFNTTASKFQLYQSTDWKNSLSNNQVLAFVEIDSSNVWVSTKDGINEWDRSTGTFTKRNIFPGEAHILSRQKNTIIAAISRNGFYTYEIQTGYKKHYFLIKNDSTKGLLGNHIKSIRVDENENIWLGQNEGLSVLEAESGRFLHFRDEKYKGGLNGIAVPEIELDAENQVWVINNNKIGKFHCNVDSLFNAGFAGLVKDTTLYSFEVFHQAKSPSSLTMNENELIIGDNGISRLDVSSGKITRIESKDGLTSNRVLSLELDKQGNIWAGTDNGLIYINNLTAEVSNFYKEDGLQGNYFQEGAILAWNQANY